MYEHENETNHPRAISWYGRDSIRNLHEILFSTNIASSFVYAALIYISSEQARESPVDDSTYYFLRSAFRINDILRVSSIGAVSTNAVARQFPSRWGQVGCEVSIVLTVFGIAALVLFLLRLIGGLSVPPVLLGRVAGMTALLGIPASRLYAEKVTWNWASPPMLLRVSSFSQNPVLAVFGGEILCICLLFGIYRNRSISGWAMGTLLFLHYAFWVPVLWPKIKISFYELFAPFILLLIFLSSGIVWLIYLKKLHVGPSESCGRTRTGNWTYATAIVALAVLIFVWFPRRGMSLAHPRDMSSLTIQMSRGPCFGPCPTYNLTIHGNGLVEYVGGRSVKVSGPQETTATHEQVIQLLQILDRIQFSDLEDRAFAWCFDTNSVAVSVSVDGNTKNVVSDGYCVGAKSGHQARFVEATSEIDNMVGSGRWVKCDGRCSS